MQSMIVLAAMALLAGVPVPQTDDGPLAPARFGRIECFAPNEDKKTCKALTRYHWNAAGGIGEEMLIAITSIPLTAFRMKMAVTVENGMICSVGTQDTLAAADVLQNGMPVAPEDADNARRAAYEQFAPVFGKKVCEDPSPYGKVVAVEYVIDGKPKPALANWVKWIKQNENYSLALRQPQ